MNNENKLPQLPEEIDVNEKFFVDEEGKRFLYEEGGVKYGGDYLPEPPASISRDEDFPPPPPEQNFVL